MFLIISLSLFLNVKIAWADNVSDNMVTVPGGVFTPFFKESKDKDIQIKSILIDKFPVTKNDFNNFLLKFPNYKKNKIIALFVDQRYLQDWTFENLTAEDLKTKGSEPVTYVSWFVAKKYCNTLGKRLPTIAEWEFASDSMNPDILKELLEWYAKTGDQPGAKVGLKRPNKFGLYDMHGLIWEWVDDFSSVMISSDSRSKGDRTDGFFCGGGSVSSLDPKSYATFMRYGFRSGLRGDYTMQNLGFRCVKDFKNEGAK